MQHHLRPAYTLSWIIAALMVIASLGGLLMPTLYRDSTLIARGWVINDAVTLALGVPLLVGALVFVRRGSQRGLLLWLGMLQYALYNYAFYLFGAALNWLFLIYVALFALAIFAMLIALLRLDVRAIAASFAPRTPVRWLSGYMLFWAMGLAALWIGMWFVYMTSGVPPIPHLGAEGQKLTAALDLALVIAPLIPGAVWLWQRQPWGYVIAVMLNVKGVLYTLTLAGGSLMLENAGVAGSAAQVPLWLGLCIASLISALVLLVNMHPAARRDPVNQPNLTRPSTAL